MFSNELKSQASSLLQALRERHLTFASAESCTGGLLAGLLTEIPGSSDVVMCGFVTYSNAAKMKMLAVPADILETHGAVSAQAAEAMAAGALAAGDVDVSVAITGIAGPGGGTGEKPVGLVFLHARQRSGGARQVRLLCGDVGRERVRLKALQESITLCRELLGSGASG